MCSVQDGDVIITQLKPTVPIDTCMKCGEKAVLVIRVTDGFCKDCFLQHCNHQFRAAFGKTKIVRHNEQVLVAYSGGHSSAALLHLLQTSLGGETQFKKKFKVQPGIVHIDETSVINPHGEDLVEKERCIVEAMERTGLPYYHVHLSEGLGDESSLGDVTLGLSSSERLSRTFASIKTNTAKEDYLKVLRSAVLYGTARQYGYTKIMVGDNASTMAVTVLSNVAQGRGAHLPLDAAFADKREDLIVVRPLRSFNAKEVVMYNVLSDVKSVAMPSLTTMADSKASIQRLTEAFVTGLQASFPATVSTVCRTGSKMKFNANSSGISCRLCRAPIDTCVGEASALRAADFSASLATPKNTSGGDVTGDVCVTSAGDNRVPFTDDTIVGALCYGCRRLVKDVNSPQDVIPVSGPADETVLGRR